VVVPLESNVCHLLFTLGRRHAWLARRRPRVKRRWQTFDSSGTTTRNYSDVTARAHPPTHTQGGLPVARHDWAWQATCTDTTNRHCGAERVSGSRSRDATGAQVDRTNSVPGPIRADQARWARSFLIRMKMPGFGNSWTFHVAVTPCIVRRLACNYRAMTIYMHGCFGTQYDVSATELPAW